MDTAVAYTISSPSVRMPRTRKTRPVHDDLDLDNDDLNARVESRLEDFFTRQRELTGEESLPEGCVSLETSYRNSVSRLNELYA